jgi:hypothetical protein
MSLRLSSISRFWPPPTHLHSLHNSKHPMLATTQASYLFAPAMTRRRTSSHTREKAMEASTALSNLELRRSNVRDDERVECCS